MEEDSAKSARRPVLVVEDNLVNQRVTSLMLGRLGLPYRLVSNGREALDLFGREKFSIVLMDCMMPELDGFETTTAIRKLEALTGAYTPVVAVTALSMTGDRERCIAAGMDDYLAKPIDIDMLSLKLTHWLKEDVVYRQHKFKRYHDDLAVLEKQPVNLQELVEFYGEDQMHQIIQIFIDTTRDLLKRLSCFVKERDSRAVAGLAHELKSSCASVGAKQLAKLCLFLEQAAGQEDWLEAEETLASFNKLFAHCQEFILTVTWYRAPDKR